MANPIAIDVAERLSELGGRHADEIVRQNARKPGAKTKTPGPSPTDVRKQSFDRPETWVHVAWRDIGHEQNGRSFPSSQYADDGVRPLRPGNLAPDGTISWTEAATRHLPLELAARASDLRIGASELVMNLTAQSLNDEFLGRVCMTGEEDECILNQRIARVSATGLSPRCVLCMLAFHPS